MPPNNYLFQGKSLFWQKADQYPKSVKAIEVECQLSKAWNNFKGCVAAFCRTGSLLCC